MYKNRTAVAAGILALALVVGGIALYSNRDAQKAPETAEQIDTDEPTVPASATPDDTETTDNTDGTENPTTTTTDNTDNNTSTPTTTTTVPETYTVQQGDTLRDIANRFYGDPDYSGDIERVNELENPNNIPVGKVLNMPRPEELNAPATAPQTEKTDDNADNTPMH